MATKKDMSGIVQYFNGCFCVQMSDNSASLCGEVGNSASGGGKFVMLLKLKPSASAVHVTLKAENENLANNVFEQLAALL